MPQVPETPPNNSRRVYPLSPRDLTEEQIAVAFAMTSRRPEPFDEIALQVSAERAADFNERWVMGYGHASVAEHAIVHLAVENISRLACDTLEDNRLASFTEKSSRYQVIDPESFHVPQELEPVYDLKSRYVTVCRSLFVAYARLIQGVTTHLETNRPRGDNESDGAYALRLRRQATDACRAVLPAATLTNVGVTANARTLEHAISKLMSASLDEERALGTELREQGRSITPTLVKYADYNPYFAAPRSRAPGSFQQAEHAPNWCVRLLEVDGNASRKLCAALLFRRGDSYADAMAAANGMSVANCLEIINDTVRDIGPHDAPPREFELVAFTFEFVFDYGALREFRRHRMQTYVSQPLTVANGFDTPPLIGESGMAEVFGTAISEADGLFRTLAEENPALAQYAVTHAHRQRVLSKMNLRECYHLFKLRSSRQAHFAIRQPVLEAMRLAVDAEPELFRHLPLRNAPDWWPFTQG